MLSTCALGTHPFVLARHVLVSRCRLLRHVLCLYVFPVSRFSFREDFRFVRPEDVYLVDNDLTAARSPEDQLMCDNQIETIEG